MDVTLLLVVLLSTICGAYEEVSHEKGLPDSYAAFIKNVKNQSRQGGGHVAQVNAFPWTVSMQVFGSHYCSATIISATRLLTAAQCTIDKIPSGIQYRAGSRDYKSGGQFLFVESVHNHPDYNPDTLENDIAVVWLKTRINLAASGVAALNLPDAYESVEVETIAVVSRWECVGPNANLMKYSHVTIISNAHCNGYYRGKVEDSMLCADVPALDEHNVRGDSVDYCQHDVGGPVADVIKHLVVGVVVWGHGCTKPERPGVYSRVAHYRHWIDSVM